MGVGHLVTAWARHPPRHLLGPHMGRVAVAGY